MIDEFSKNVHNIQDLIDTLEAIKNYFGNLPLMSEYDGDYELSCKIIVQDEHNPKDYLGDKIKVVMIK